MNDRIREQFIRDEIAKAEKQDAAYFSHQEHLNRKRMRREALRILGTDIIIAAVAISALVLLASVRGWI